jgi:hypothetical protein
LVVVGEDLESEFLQMCCIAWFPASIWPTRRAHFDELFEKFKAESLDLLTVADSDGKFSLVRIEL